MDEEKLVLTMPMIAWERAKGEMNVVLQSCLYDETDGELFAGARIIIDRFINDFEYYMA
jgi:hypothetical protein